MTPYRNESKASSFFFSMSSVPSLIFAFGSWWISSLHDRKMRRRGTIGIVPSASGSSPARSSPGTSSVNRSSIRFQPPIRSLSAFPKSMPTSSNCSAIDGSPCRLAQHDGSSQRLEGGMFRSCSTSRIPAAIFLTELSCFTSSAIP